MSGPFEEDWLGEEITNEILCQLIFEEATNFLTFPLTDSYVCELVDKALSMKTDHLSCLVCKLSHHTECICLHNKYARVESEIEVGKNCERNLSLDSGVEVDLANCDTPNPSGTSTLLNPVDFLADVGHRKSCSSFKSSESCTSSTLSEAESITSSRNVIMSPPSSKAARKLRLTSSSVTPECERCARCSCKIYSQLNASGRVATAGQAAPMSEEEDMHIDISDSGIGLESEDPGFYEMESGSDEDWDEDSEANASLEPHICQKPNNHLQDSEASSLLLYQCKQANVDSENQAESTSNKSFYVVTSQKTETLEAVGNKMGPQILPKNNLESSEPEPIISHKELKSPVRESSSDQGKKASETHRESVGTVQSGKKMLSTGSKVMCLYLLFLPDAAFFSFCSLAIPIGVRA